MKVYVAGAYAARDALREHVVPILADHRHECTSGWLQGTRAITTGTIGTSPDSSDDDVHEFVQGDLDDIARADVVLLFTGAGMVQLDPRLVDASLHTGGRHFESGYAHALQMDIVLVGPPENVFQRSLALKAKDMEHALRVLSTMPRYLRGL